MSRTRHTFNVNTMEIGDEALLHHTLRRWQPSAIMAMGGKDGPNKQARTLIDLVENWGGFGIYRPFEMSEGHLWRARSPQEQVNWLKSFKDDRWWYNVGNEPIPGGAEVKRMVDWYAEFIDIAVAAGLNVIIPGGFATGAFQWEQIERGDFDPMLAAIGKYADLRLSGRSRVMLGAHTYTHALIPLGTAGRPPSHLISPQDAQPDRWPTQAEIFDGDESDNWLVLRENWLVNRIMDITLRRIDQQPLRIDVAITECFLDRMPHIETEHREVTAKIDQMAGRRVQGMPTLAKYWATMFPQWSPTQALIQQMQWVEDVYPTVDDALPGDYVCFAWFAWNKNAQWREGYDWEQNPAILIQWGDHVSEAKSPPVPPPLPEPNPTISDQRWRSVLVENIGGLPTNVRLGPTTKYSVIAQLNDPLPYLAHFIPLNAQTEAERLRTVDGVHYWLAIKLHDQTVGWVRNDTVTFTSPATPDPDPPIPPAIMAAMQGILRAQAEIDRQLAVINDHLATIIKESNS